MLDTDAEQERRIRERAYFLWLEAGCPDGRSVEFWHQAQTLDAGSLLRAGNLASSSAADRSAGRVAGERRRSDAALQPPSPSGAAPAARPAPRPHSALLGLIVVILGTAWVVRHVQARRAEAGISHWAWL